MRAPTAQERAALERRIQLAAAKIAVVEKRLGSLRPLKELQREAAERLGAEVRREFAREFGEPLIITPGRVRS